MCIQEYDMDEAVYTEGKILILYDESDIWVRRSNIDIKYIKKLIIIEKIFKCDIMGFFISRNEYNIKIAKQLNDLNFEELELYIRMI